MINTKKLSNEKLYKLCEKYGYMTLEARRKFMGLLPEVYRRHLYKEKGYSTIYEFAGKLAGLSNPQVDLTLRLEKKFADKPILRKALVEGEVSINKLSRITSIATKENERELFEKTKKLSNRAVEVFIRDVRNYSKVQLEGQKMHVHKTPEDQKMHVQKTPEDQLNLDSDVREKLQELQEKGIDINEFLRDALKQREQEISQKKKEIGEEEIRKYNEKMKKTKPKISPPSRYINVEIKKVLKQEYGTKCSIPHCRKSAKIIHHTQRFALNPIHDPRFLAPLCEEHHEIAHRIDVQVLNSSTFATPPVVS